MNRWLGLSIALAVVALTGSLYLYGVQREQWPEQVPTHWGLQGPADGFSSRESPGLWLGLPGLMVGWIGLSLLLPWLSPQGFKVDGFRPTYDYLMCIVNGFFLYLHSVVLFGAFGPSERTLVGIIAGVFLLFALLGAVLGQVKRNFWMGVRTPWTLADEGVWEAVHRQTAYLFTIAGLVGFVAALLGVPLLVLFVGLMLVALWPAVYSLVLYKHRERNGQLKSN